jgi:hypothetical protein
MKRAVICVTNPWDYIPLYDKNYSIMVESKINVFIDSFKKQLEKGYNNC